MWTSARRIIDRSPIGDIHQFLLSGILIISLYFSVLPVLAESTPAAIGIGRFSAGELFGLGHPSTPEGKVWDTHQFVGETGYQLVSLEGVTVLQADSRQSASGLIKKQRIDLEQTPWLEWRWRIANRLPAADETRKAGDDYAARVYVVIDGGLLFWRTRALNYVWANTSSQGRVWPNAFAGSNAMMMALRSSEHDTGVWYSERRNVRDDLRQVFGEDIRYIDAIALMTDTDNGGGEVIAWYGDIRLLGE
ncbi:MAG: DUF3047 domain-containing protein [Gammaproteobacteria bacterium]|nr:MAG: DUF3047 domain-containing protein [Gammaproteobacteria bacterium]